MKFIDLTSRVFGDYIVVGYCGKSKWCCKCKCNESVIVKGSDLTKNKATKCRKCSDASKRVDTAAFNKLYSDYKIGARDRNFSFNLDKKFFKFLTSDVCHYCGLVPSSKSVTKHDLYVYNGIDRLDSNLGYEINNVVSCCEFCNKLKRETSYADFKEYIKRLIEFQKNKITKDV